MSLRQASGLSLSAEPRLPHAEMDLQQAVSLPGTVRGEILGPGKGLIIFGAQNMSHLEPVRGGHSAGGYSVD